MQRCIATVMGDYRSSQCQSNGKYLHNEKAYCGTHYPPNIEERNEKRRTKEKADYARAKANRLEIAYINVAKDLNMTVEHLKSLK